MVVRKSTFFFFSHKVRLVFMVIFREIRPLADLYPRPIKMRPRWSPGSVWSCLRFYCNSLKINGGDGYNATRGLISRDIAVLILFLPRIKDGLANYVYLLCGLLRKMTLVNMPGIAYHCTGDL